MHSEVGLAVGQIGVELNINLLDFGSCGLCVPSLNQARITACPLNLEAG